MMAGEKNDLKDPFAYFSFSLCQMFLEMCKQKDNTSKLIMLIFSIFMLTFAILCCKTSKMINLIKKSKILRTKKIIIFILPNLQLLYTLHYG